jgi:hypothetical protein
VSYAAAAVLDLPAIKDAPEPDGQTVPSLAVFATGEESVREPPQIETPDGRVKVTDVEALLKQATMPVTFAAAVPVDTAGDGGGDLLIQNDRLRPRPYNRLNRCGPFVAIDIVGMDFVASAVDRLSRRDTRERERLSRGDVKDTLLVAAAKASVGKAVVAIALQAEEHLPQLRQLEHLGVV